MNSRAQSTMEMALLVLVIVAALFAMQVYLKRGIQGRMRSNIESIGSQYDPAATNSFYEINHISNTKTTTVSVPVDRSSGAAHWTVLATVTNSETILDTTHRTGNEVVGSF